MRNRSVLTFLLPALLLSSWAARAQLAPSPDEPPVSNAPAPAVNENPVASFKVEVNLVDVFFTARAKDNILAPHLTKEDCTVAEDKVPQKLKSFTAETDLPLTLGIVLDTSGSQTRVLPLEQDAGSQFLSRIMRRQDQAFVVSVDVNVDLLQDMTNSVRLLTRALNKAEINSGVGFGAGPVPTPGGPRGTVLYDAVELAANAKLRQETGRKALIMLTDGEDQGSRAKIGEAIAAAQRWNVAVYVILIADVQGYLQQGMGYYGYSPMKKMAEETGGRLISVGNNSKKLNEAFEQIEDELRTQYAASYTSSNEKHDGAFRHISVECRGDNFKIQTRKGYFAPGPRD